MHDPAQALVQLGQAMRAVREHLGRSQDAIAHRMGRGRQHLSSFENGHRLPIPDTWELWLTSVTRGRAARDDHLDDLLQHARRLYELARRDAAMQPELTQPAHDAQLSTTNTAAGRHAPEIDADVNHWDLAERLTRSSISVTALGQLGQVVDSYAVRYPTSPPSMLMPAVNLRLRQLYQVLQQPQPLAVRRRAVQLVGTLLGIRGNLLLDVGRDYDAAEAFAVGKLAGEEAEDPGLTAWVLATESIGAFFAGRLHEAVRLLEEARQRATPGSSARRRSWILAFLARGYAAAGAADHAFTALEAARAALAEADPPQGIDFFDAARLEGLEGTTHLLLRDPAHAYLKLEAARAQRATADRKGRALLTLDLAACRGLEGEGEESCRLIDEALDLAGESIVGPIIARAQAVRASVGSAAGKQALAQVDQRLAELGR